MVETVIKHLTESRSNRLSWKIKKRGRQLKHGTFSEDSFQCRE